MKKISPTYKLITIIATTASIAIILIYYSITQRSVRQNTDRFFQSPGTSAANTILTSRQQKIIGVQYALRENNIPQAIDGMPVKTAKDFYNRATLKTLRAYQLMEQDDGLYKDVLKEAEQDFLIAASKTNNIYLQNRINNNAGLSKNIEYIGDIQICFTDFNTVLDDLATITNTVNQTRNSIQSQLQYIQQNTKKLNNVIGAECQKRIKDTLNKAYDALTRTSKSIQQYTDSYTKILSEHIDNPLLCLQANLNPIIQDTQSSKTKLKESQQMYAITDMALQKENLGILQQMCEQTQDDTLSNQDLEKSLSQLLENLEESIQSSSELKEDKTQDSGQENTQTPGPATSQPQYIPLTQEEKTLLEQAQKNNKQRINTMMEIKKNNYNPAQTLDTIFKIFYGDASEFNIPGR